jgi:hypothetical protein
LDWRRDIRVAARAPALAGHRCKVTDSDGKFWAYIGAPDGWPIGWFHRELISYN